MRRPGVRTLGRQSGHTTRNRRRADPDGRLKARRCWLRQGRDTPTFLRLFTLANAEDRRKPRLDPALLREYAGGVVLLTGGRGGPLAKLLADVRREDAKALLRDYLGWYGAGSVYVELQQNLLQGDTERNRESARLARGGRRSRGGDQRRSLPLA